MPEPRTAVMILVEASWADQTGALQAVPACMENKSAGGACIRIKTPIWVGSKLKIQGRWEQISGTAKYCRSVGKDYLVGIQRDTATNIILDRPILTDAPIREGVRSSDLLVPTTQVQSQPKPPESKVSQTPAPEPKVENVPILAIPSLMAPTSPDLVVHEIESRDRPRISQPQEPDARWTELETKRPAKGKEIGKERKPMQRKWSELMHRHNQQDEVIASGIRSNGKGEKENGAHQAAPATEETSADPVREGVASFPIELSPVEDIYRAAGITNLRRGYSISKVVEMVHSEHARGLSKEAKRAAVLMALDAAGIPVEEVLQDAKARRDALDSYEAEVRKEVEAEWAQKAEENVQIQAELERVKAHYMARIGRNQDGVAREKAVFNNWLTMKQQESQSIAEAAELCLKSSVSEPAAGSLPAISMAAAGAKPV
jgi:hypothetical protein